MDPSQSLKQRWPEYLALAAIAAAGAWQLFAPPLIGMADNGDFPRIMSRFDIGYLSERYEDRYFRYFVSKYRIDERDRWINGFVSSQTLLVALALPLNSVLSKPGFFDIRAVGFIHLALELGAAWLLLRYAPVGGGLARGVFLGILVVALSDAGWVSYFNSFYSEPGSFVFLLLTVGTILMVIQRPRPGALLAFCVASLFFITSKPQNVSVGVLLGVYAAGFSRLRAGKPWRWYCAGAAVCLISGSVAYYRVQSVEIAAKPTYYLGVFYGILRFSSDPGRDLEELGLDRDLARYAGSIPFAQESPRLDPAFERAFFERISFGKMIAFHLRHPVRFLEALQRDVWYAPLVQPALGNYERSAGRPPFTVSSSFALWSSAHEACFPGSLGGLATFFALNLAGIAVLYRKGNPAQRSLLELCGIFLLSALIQLVTIVVSQSDYEPIKHQFLFHLLVDVCIAMAVVWLTGVAQRAAAGIRRRAGSTPQPKFR